MKSTAQDWIVTLFGAVTSLVVGVLAWWIEQTFGFSVYSWMFWFVVPVGALLCGAVAASGYYGGAILFNHKPKPIMLLNMVAISIGTYFLIQYLDYSSAEIEGKKVSDMVSFGRYWQVVTSHSAVQFRLRAAKVGDAVQLGGWGYLYAFLQVTGFAAGGLAVYGHLSSRVYCDKCSLFFTSKGKVERYTSDPEHLKSFLGEMASLAEQGKLAEIIELHAAKAGGPTVADCHLMTELHLQHCKKCDKHHLAIDVKKKKAKNENEWDSIDGMSYATFTDTPLSLSKRTAA